MSSLANKTVLVTGAGQGIGQAGAYLFAEQGARVVLTDINVQAIDSHAQAIRDAGGDALAIRLDVTDIESTRAAIRDALDEYGRIDGLFHNAMSAAYVNNHDGRITELDPAVWDRIIQLVLTGTFHVVRELGRVMLEQRAGSMVLTSTVDAVIGQAGIDAYSAAKGGVLALTRSAAAGMSPEGVRINAVCPSFVTTPDQAAFLEQPEQRAVFEAMHLLGISEPRDIAQFAAFLLSDAARMVTGAVHMVDAGYSCFKGRMDTREMVETR